MLGELGARANWGAIAAEYLQGNPPSTPLGEIDAAHWATRPARKARD